MRLLENAKVAYEEIDLSSDFELRMELTKKTGWKTVPMIFIGEQFIGGYQDLAKLQKEDPTLLGVANPDS